MEIERRLSNPGLPVLFVSDPIKGDLFEFGTWEELEAEFEERQAAGEDCEFTTSDDLYNRLDFSVYEDNEPRIRAMMQYESRFHRVMRVRDGLFYKGPMYRNVFTENGKVYKTRDEAQRLINAYADYRAFDNGELVIIEGENNA